MPARFFKTRAATRSLVLLGGLCLVAEGTAQLMAGSDTSTRSDAPPLRMAVSEKVVCGVNLNDAKAAMSVWAQELLKTADLKFVVTPGQDWVMPSDQLLEAIRDRKLDLFCVTVHEYRRVALFVDTTHIITDDYGGEELLLLVREDGRIASLADLRGRSLILQESPNTSLAEPWLTVSLWKEGLESPQQLLGHMTTNTKLSQVVLPVFFGQADACVVTRRGLDTMVELNPQLARKLKVLRASPQMESAFFACRKDCPLSLKNPLFERLLKLKSSVTTRQVLTLFQSPGFADRDANCLGPANALLDAYERHRESAVARKR